MERLNSKLNKADKRTTENEYRNNNKIKNLINEVENL